MINRPERPDMRRWEDRIHAQHVAKIEAYVEALNAERTIGLCWLILTGCAAWTAAMGLMWLWLPR